MKPSLKARPPLPPDSNRNSRNQNEGSFFITDAPVENRANNNPIASVKSGSGGYHSKQNSYSQIIDLTNAAQDQNIDQVGQRNVNSQHHIPDSYDLVEISRETPGLVSQNTAKFAQGRDSMPVGVSNNEPSVRSS